jgi:hypothetical protein
MIRLTQINKLYELAPLICAHATLVFELIEKKA